MSKSKTSVTTPESELYCVCHGRDNGLFMYQCDVCGEWFHGACTGLTEYEVEHKSSENVVLCPDCCLEHIPLSDLDVQQRRVLRGEIVPGARGIIIKKIDLQNHNETERRQRFILLLAGCLSSTDSPSNVDERCSLARQHAEAVEKIIYETAHCDSKSSSYRLRTRSVLIALQEDSSLRTRIMNGECTAAYVAAAEPSTLSVVQSQVKRRLLAETIRQENAATGVDGDVSFGSSGDSVSGTKRNSSGDCQTMKKKTRLASAEVVWNGTIERNLKSTHGPCSVSGQYVSGTENLYRLVPEHIMFAGKFELDELLEYLHQLGHSTSRKRAALLLEPCGTQDAVHYNAMYRHFMDKRRAGFLQRAAVEQKDEEKDSGSPEAKPKSLEAEELYMVPLQRGATLPKFLCDDPFTNKDALAGESSHPRLLLVIVARNTTIAEVSKRAVEEAKATRSESSESLVPPLKKEDSFDLHANDSASSTTTTESTKTGASEVEPKTAS